MQMCLLIEGSFCRIRARGYQQQRISSACSRDRDAFSLFLTYIKTNPKRARIFGKFLIICVAEMGVLLAYLVSLVTTLAVSAMVLSAVVSFTASNTNHRSQYISRGNSISKELHSKHDARLRTARSPRVSSIAPWPK